MKWLPWIVFAFFGFYLVGNNFTAKLGMIDDHEIANFLGSDGKIGLTEIPRVIMTTEVGQWGTYLRYRPSYYTLRVIETALWRNNATLWYVSRYIMLIISMWLGWRILTIFFPTIVAYAFIFYLMTLPFWPDLLTRLGPSEIYTIPAVLLFLYGMVEKKLWMLTLGYVICIGSKENFIFIFPLLLGWAGYKVITKKLTKSELITTILLTAYTSFIVGAILVATGKAQTDIYGSQINYFMRIARLYQYKRYIVETRHLQIPLLIILGGVVKMVWEIIHDRTKQFMESSVPKYLLSISIIGLIIVSQYLFYDSQLPSRIRYDFPVMVLFPILQLLTLELIITSLPKKILRIKTSLILYTCLVIVIFSFVFKRGYGLIHSRSIANSVATQNFDKNLQLASKAAKENPDSTIVYVSDKYFSFEPMISVARFLTAKGVGNNMVISYTREPNLSDPLGIELENRIAASMEGVVIEDKSFERFSPTSSISESCYSITFGDATPLPECPTIAKF